MTEIDGFRAVATLRHEDAHLTLDRKHTGLVPHSGRVARWMAAFHGSANRAVTKRFVESLRSGYGAEVSGQVIASSGLDDALERGRPLRARQVRAALEHADALRDAIRQGNAELGRSYGRPAAAGTDMSLVRLKFDDVLRRVYPRNPSVGNLVRVEDVASKVDAAIAAAGRDGAHYVTTEEAADILSRIVSAELRSGYMEARERALGRLDLRVPESIATQALVAAGAGQDPPIDPARLTDDARDEMASRFESALSDAAVPADRLDDAASLRQLADAVMAQFVAERTAAAAAVGTVSMLDALEHAALREQALHDIATPKLVASMEWAYLTARDDVAALGKPLDARELERTVGALRDAMSGGLASAGVEVSVENQGRMYRTFWRFLMAPGGDAQADAMAAALGAGDGALRAIGEGAAWYRRELPETEEAERTYTPFNATDARPVYPAGSFQTAAQYAVMLGGLVDVLNEGSHTVPELRAASSNALGDEGVATLRNLQIPMPAPDRRGAANGRVRISAPAMAAVEQELKAHVRAVGTQVRAGLVEEAVVDYPRATYRIGGELAPRTEQGVTDALRAFCTDAHGVLNEGLLRNVSLVAYQAGPGCVYGTCFNPMRPDIAVFAGLPDVAPDENSFTITRDDRGDVLVQCVRAGQLRGLDLLTASGSVDRAAVDRDASHVSVGIRFRLDPAGGEPRVDDVEISYGIQPGERPAEDVP